MKRENFKDGIYGFLGTIAVCAAIITVVFGFLGGLIELDFALSIARFTGAVLALSIYIMVVVWVFSFEWTESPFIKATLAGVILAILSFIVYEIFDWQLFYVVFIICAVIAAAAVAIGLIKTIFSNA